MDKSLCQICHNRQFVSWQYGAFVCTSCKAFFERSETNQAYIEFKCNSNQKCTIMFTSYYKCRYCRYHKCKQLGMNLNCKHLNRYN